MLTLYEKLYLLILDDEKGNLIPSTRKSFVYSMAGAILSELVLSGALVAGDKLRLEPQEGAAGGDSILDSVLQQVRDAGKLHKPTFWVSQLSAEPKKLRYSIGEQLVEKNILTQDEKRFFRAQSGGDPAAPSKFELKLTLRTMILSHGERDLKNLTLIKMIAAGGLLSLCFTADEIDAAEQVIRTQLLSAALEDSKMELVEEIGQAVSSVLEDEMD